MCRFLLVLVLAFFPARAALAQASLSCPMQPQTLRAMQHCYRPVLVFAPSARGALLQEQTGMLDAAADDMMDRFILLTPVVPEPQHYVTPLDAPYIVLGEREMRAIRDQFRVPLHQFEVLLLGEKGQVLLRSDRPVGIRRMKACIDVLPLRKIEETRRGAN